MAKEIATYEAKDLKLDPSNSGYAAAEQAARRIGQFASQAAQAVRQVAQLQAKSLEDQGQQQTAFARALGLEAAQRGDSEGGVKIRYGGGLQDMFQLGAGGNEPNYDRLNRLAELSEMPVQISRAARGIVNAQSPLTKTNPQTVFNRANPPDSGWIGNYDPKHGGIAPNPDVTDEEAEKAGFNMSPSFLKPDTDPTSIGFRESFNIPGQEGGGMQPALGIVPPGYTMGPNPVGTDENNPGGTDMMGVGPNLGPQSMNIPQLPTGQAFNPTPYANTSTFPSGAVADPSQNPSAPPIYDMLRSGMVDPSQLDQA